MIYSVFGDLRFALRVMRRSPGFTAIVILTLAFGIAANTALFTVVDAVLLKPLPVRNPNELALLVWDAPDRDIPLLGGYSGTATSDLSTTGHLQGTSFPYVTFERLRQATDTFADVFAFATGEKLNVIADGQAEVAFGQFVTADYYDGLGVRAWRGRLLGEANENANAAPAAVITWRYWQRRLYGRHATRRERRLTLPLATEPLVRSQNSAKKYPSLWFLRIMTRLRSGVTRQRAQARVDALFQQSVADSEASIPAEDKQAIGTIGPDKYPHLLLTPGAQGDGFDRRQ